MAKDAGDDGNVKLTYVYADGQYGNFDVKLGKMPLYSTADDGLVVDDYFSGARLVSAKTQGHARSWPLEPRECQWPHQRL